MTGRQIAERVGVWKRRLRLQDWEIAVRAIAGTEIDDDACGAQVWRQTHRRAATIVIATERDAATIEMDVAHEMVHITLHPLWTIIQQAADRLSPDAAELLRRAAMDAEEIVVEAIAEAMVEAYGDGSSGPTS
jgi:hypothetical protein